jgi:5-methylcytosine-specific restriction endonuclease McrA
MISSTHTYSKMHVCVDCGSDFWGRSPTHKFCETCKKNHVPVYTKLTKVEKKCAGCGRTFWEGKTNQRYCSKECSLVTRTVNIGVIDRMKREYFHEKYLYTCQHCGELGINTELHVHHIIPLCQRGENTEDNLTLLCVKCHHVAHGMTGEHKAQQRASS